MEKQGQNWTNFHHAIDLPGMEPHFHNDSSWEKLWNTSHETSSTSSSKLRVLRCSGIRYQGFGRKIPQDPPSHVQHKAVTQQTCFYTMSLSYLACCKSIPGEWNLAGKSLKVFMGQTSMGDFPLPRLIARVNFCQVEAGEALMKIHHIETGNNTTICTLCTLMISSNTRWKGG